MLFEHAVHLRGADRNEEYIKKVITKHPAFTTIKHLCVFFICVLLWALMRQENSLSWTSFDTVVMATI